jgi:hypothetical protein
MVTKVGEPAGHRQQHVGLNHTLPLVSASGPLLRASGCRNNSAERQGIPDGDRLLAGFLRIRNRHGAAFGVPSTSGAIGSRPRARPATLRPPITDLQGTGRDGFSAATATVTATRRTGRPEAGVSLRPSAANAGRRWGAASCAGGFVAAAFNRGGDA